MGPARLEVTSQGCLLGQCKPFKAKICFLGHNLPQEPFKNWSGYFSRFCALAENFYIFIIAGLEPGGDVKNTKRFTAI